MGEWKDIGWTLLRYRAQLIVIVTTLAFLPMPLVIGDKASWAGYLMILMAVFWCSDVVPLAVTGLIPIFFLPLAEIMPLSDVCKEYLRDNSMMFTGAVMLAICVEYVNLHRRVALSIIRLVGTQPRWLMLGFMMPTFILSMFISNTATTAMMLPILEAVLEQLEGTDELRLQQQMEQHQQEQDGDDEEDGEQGSDENKDIAETSLDAIDCKLESPTQPATDTIDSDEDKVMEKPSIENADIKIECLEIQPVLDSYVKHRGASGSLSWEMENTLIYARPSGRLDGHFISGSEILDSMESTGSSFNVAKATARHEEENAGVDREEKQRFIEYCKGMTLSVAYSANVGGVGTLTGTSTNTIMKGHLDDIWASHGLGESPVTYASWLVYGLPIAILNFFVVWAWLQILYLGFKVLCGCFTKTETDPERDERVKSAIKKEYDALGPIRFAEVAASFLFVTLILLWFFRSPGFMPGWGDYFKEGYVGDAVPAIMIAFTLFFVPSTMAVCCLSDLESNTKPVPTLLKWEIVHRKYPWSILFLMGGGYALGEACAVSGLSDWIGEALAVFGALPGWLMVFILCFLVSLLTEVTSNSATCTILMPIMDSMAQTLGMNPMYLMMPVAVSCSLAFCLPAATPPNAIAFSYGRIVVGDMAKAGFMLNFLCAIVVTLATETWGYAFFEYDVIPWETDGGNATSTTDSMPVTALLLA